MTFQLPRQTSHPEMDEIISREIKRQKLKLFTLSKKQQKEVAQIASEIEKREIPSNLVCKKLPGVFGMGIFLHPKAKPIRKNQVISFYSGEVSLVPQTQVDDSAYLFDLLSDMRLTKQEQAFVDKKNRYHPRRRYSLQVDALKKGNFTRFINHSGKPNIVAHLVKGPKGAPIEVVYLAKTIIYPGEQLLVSYEHEEKSYWGPMKVKPFPVTPKTFQLSPSLKLIKS
jgi:hypothetical protein